MTDARAKYVQSEMIDLWTRSSYLHDHVSRLDREIYGGETIEIPYLSAFTIIAAGSTGGAAESITTSVLTLTANLEPMINAILPVLSRLQNCNAAWASGVAESAVLQLKSSIDSTFSQYLAYSLCYNTAASYHINVVGDSLTEQDIADAQALLMATDGTRMENLAFFVHPYAYASLLGIAGFIPKFEAAEAGILGIPKIGSVFGIPVFQTNSIQRNAAVASTVVEVTDDVATVTVASGHGMVPGLYLSNSGWTNSGTNTGTVPISSVGATSILMPYDAANGAQADGIGTVTNSTCWNLMVDTKKIWTALQKIPTVRLVPVATTTSDNLQCSAVWGRIGYAGGAVVVHSPGSSG